MKQTDNLLLVVRIQFIAYTSFAQNEWQACCNYGSEDSDAEQFMWTCRMPVQETFSGCLRMNQLKGTCRRFNNVQFMHRNIDDTEEAAEVRDMKLIESPSGDEVQYLVSNPIWGDRYGVKWTWRDSEKKCSPFDTIGERRRSNLEHEAIVSQRGGRTELHTKLKNCFEESAPKSMEYTVFVIARYEGKLPAKLVQVAWNDAVEEAQRHTMVLDFGVGVAGRAAWLRDTVIWAKKTRVSQMYADVYYPEPGKDYHTAIVAVPIFVQNKDAPLAILSIAAPTEGEFANAVRKKVDDNIPVLKSELKWVKILGDKIQKILALL